MFKDMRRHDRSLMQSEAEDILLNGIYGVLSVASDNGAYGVPLSYVYTEGCIYFHCALEGEKLTCIRNNNKVTFCVVGKATPLPDKFSMEYASAIVYGKVSEVTEMEKKPVLLAFIEKYSCDYIEQGKLYVDNAHQKTVVIKLQIEHITGKARK